MLLHRAEREAPDDVTLGQQGKNNNRSHGQNGRSHQWARQALFKLEKTTKPYGDRPYSASSQNNGKEKLGPNHQKGEGYRHNHSSPTKGIVCMKRMREES